MGVRISINYTGRVQGVGFRWRVSQIAKSFSCTGYVKNLLDGSVELLIEGKKEEAYRLVELVNIQMKEFWHNKTVDKRAGDAHFSKFTIKY